MSRLLITESATSDIDEIWDYVADDSAERADASWIRFIRRSAVLVPIPVVDARIWQRDENSILVSGKLPQFIIAAIQNRPLFSLYFMGTATFLPFCGSGKIATKAPLQSAECLFAFRFTRQEDPPAVPR